MYAVVRETTYDLEKRAQGDAQVQEFSRIRAQQPGYLGAVTVDTGNGRMLSMVLWESKEQQEAAGAKLTPEAERLMGPLWTTPARIIESGNVVYNDLIQG